MSTSVGAWRTSPRVPLLRVSASPRPRVWLSALGAVALGLAYLPWLLAWCCGPSDQAGLGTFWFINDFAQYESAMRQAASSASWLVHDHFTPEPHQPALMFSLYVALGKLSAASGVAEQVLYRATELVARLGLLASLAAFCVWLLGWGRAAVLAFALAIFGMGLGMPVAIGAALLGLDQPYTGNGSYELNTFGLLFSAPHAALALGLTLLVPLLVERFFARPGAWIVAGLGLAGAALALLHPFHLAPLLASLAGWAYLAWRGGLPLPRALGGVAIPCLTALPFAAYAALTFNLDPFWGAAYRAQNLLPSPTPWELPVDLGVVLALALPGAALALRERSARRLWLLLWVAAMLAAMYLPLPYQRRFSFGLHPAMAVLAAAGCWWTWQWLVGHGHVRVARWLLPSTLALALVTTATALGGIVVSAVGNEPMRPYRATAAEAEAARWLAGIAQTTDVVLADWETSNYLAGQLPARVVGGHPVATLDARQRRQALPAFFLEDESAQRALIRQHGVTFVFWGPRERALGSLESRSWPRPVYEHGGVVVYAVEDG